MSPRFLLPLLVACAVPASVDLDAADPAAPGPVASAAAFAAPAGREPDVASRPAVAPAGAPPRPSVPKPPIADLPVPALASGHYCFTWRRGHASSSQCYASVASCNAERRAVGPVEELTRCNPRPRAFCTRVSPEGDLVEGSHCFGDLARCIAFRTGSAANAATTPCAAK